MMPKTLFLAAGIATVAGFATMPNTVVETNPCADAPIAKDLVNLPCEDANVQSGANVTIGAQGLLEADLDPIPLPLNKDTCAVNVHWHLGAEHLSRGQYDIPAADRRRLAGGDIREGFNCPAVEAGTEYAWQYCKNMHVGETYEIHWPHSNLGKCGTKWQYQYPFIDGVLCGATEAGYTAAEAVEAVFTSKDAKIGVLGQVFTVVNDGTDDYDYPMWNMLGGWNPELATDVAVYQGSTTGQAADNDQNCRATGGMVTWHVDRNCHKVSAKAFDNLCKQMGEIADDMSADMEPHGSRELVDSKYAHDIIMSRK